MHITPTTAAAIALGAQWAFSALVGGMPPPTTTSSVGYKWAFQSLQILAANFDKATKKLPDQIKLDSPSSGQGGQ